VFSSRKLERATYDSDAVRFVAANEHPDHDTIAAFRRRFLPQIEALFVQVLGVAREMGVLKLGMVRLDGTKIHANASRRSALSYERAGKIEAQPQAEVADLMARAEAADQADVADGMSIPEELARRKDRLAAIARARAAIEARTISARPRLGAMVVTIASGKPGIGQRTPQHGQFRVWQRLHRRAAGSVVDAPQHVQASLQPRSGAPTRPGAVDGAGQRVDRVV
jgi:hypothetical protein